MLMEFLIWTCGSYLAFGFIWPLFFTGTLLKKALRGKLFQDAPFNSEIIIILIVCFIVSWIAWPWSLKNNINYLK